MIAQANNVKYRYERKFHITELDRLQVESIVRTNPALFIDVYHPRWVNSLYLDSWKMTSYHETQVGSCFNRIKYRIRWYGDRFGRVESPILELKIKNGGVGRKELYPLPSMFIDEHLTADTLQELFRQADLPDELRTDLKGLKPVIANRYLRNYYLSADRQYRITIDSDIACYDASEDSRRFGFEWKDPLSVVLELKYGVESANDANRISQHFPFRLTRNSKYVTGVENACQW